MTNAIKVRLKHLYIRCTSYTLHLHFQSSIENFFAYAILRAALFSAASYTLHLHFQSSIENFFAYAILRAALFSAASPAECLRLLLEPYCAILDLGRFCMHLNALGPSQANVLQYRPSAQLVRDYSCSPNQHFSQHCNYRDSLRIDYLCSHSRALIFTLSLAGFQSGFPSSETVQHSMRVCILIGS